MTSYNSRYSAPLHFCDGAFQQFRVKTANSLGGGVAHLHSRQVRCRIPCRTSNRQMWGYFGHFYVVAAFWNLFG